MGLFGRKKGDKEEKPQFKFDDISEDFPKYEPHIGSDESNIKGAVSEVPFSPILPPPQNMPLNITPPRSDLNGRIKQGKTLFVKIDKYKDVMRALDHIKIKLEDSEKILGKLSELKEEEDKELDTWHNDLEDLKDKLLEIDKRLFEE